MATVTKEEVENAIKYLDNISKGQESMDLSPAVNGGESENISQMKADMVDHIKKAKEIKEKLDKLKKSDDFDDDDEIKEEEEDLEEKEGSENKDNEEENESNLEKGGSKKKVEEMKEKSKDGKESNDKEDREELDNEEIIKGLKTEIFNIKKSKDEELELVKSQLSEVITKMKALENTPIRKSFTSENELTFIERFEKAKSEGKTVVSKDFQKSVISDSIYNMYVESTDQFEKSELGEAITQFESAGYLSPELQRKLSEKYKIEIV